jgi:hypothetical protein
MNLSLHLAFSFLDAPRFQAESCAHRGTARRKPESEIAENTDQSRPVVWHS